MKYYTNTISVPLAEKLQERGMPIRIWRDMFSDNTGTDATFGLCFDWLMSEKGWLVSIGREYDFAAEQVTERFEWTIEKVGCFSNQPDEGGGWCNTWHEAAEAAIEKALNLI